MAKIYNGRVHAKMHALKLKSFKSRSFVITLLNKLNHIHVNSTSGHIYLFLTKKKKTKFLFTSNKKYTKSNIPKSTFIKWFSKHNNFVSANKYAWMYRGLVIKHGIMARVVQMDKTFKWTSTNSTKLTGDINKWFTNAMRFCFVAIDQIL